MEGGKRDFKTLYFLALVHHELLQFGPTLTYIDQATTIKAGSKKRKAVLAKSKMILRKIMASLNFGGQSKGAQRPVPGSKHSTRS